MRGLDILQEMCKVPCQDIVLVIYSDDWKDHMKHLKNVFRFNHRLTNFGDWNKT